MAEEKVYNMLKSSEVILSKQKMPHQNLFHNASLCFDINLQTHYRLAAKVVSEGHPSKLSWH